MKDHTMINWSKVNHAKPWLKTFDMSKITSSLTES